MSVPMVQIGKRGIRIERGANVDIQTAELWDNGDGRFSTIDVAPTRNKWNESKWFDVLTVLVIAVISVAICYKLGWI